MTSERSRSLTISDDVLRCEYEAGTVAWSTRVDDLVLIAEYTTNEGPAADDYIFVFIFMEDGHLMFAHWLSDGSIEGVLEILSERFGCAMSIGLVGSTICASRVIWPPSLAGDEYFTFTKAVPTTFLGKIQNRVWPQLEYAPSEAVWGFIREEEAKRTGAKFALIDEASL